VVAVVDEVAMMIMAAHEAVVVEEVLVDSLPLAEVGVVVVVIPPQDTEAGRPLAGAVAATVVTVTTDRVPVMTTTKLYDTIPPRCSSRVS